MTRDELARYIEQENTVNGYAVNGEHIPSIVRIIFYVGIDMYRPLVRLLLGNWNELYARISQYGEAQWEDILVLKARMEEERQEQECEGSLTKEEVAMFFEVLEGEDTENQLSTNERPITAAELRRIRGR